MQNFSASPREIFASVWRNKGLIRNLVYREVVGRYKGSMLGIFWSLVTPIFMLAVYTFVFSVVFKTRWGGSASGSQTEFALVLFAGLLIFNLFAECINRAPNLVLANTNYVKKVVFPLEILPWVTLGSALFHFSVSLGVWLLAYCIFSGLPPLTTVLIPIVLLPFLFFVIGLSWALAALGVYLRDIGQIIGIVVQILMFMSPIFYPVTALPEAYQPLLYLNPLSLPIEMMRDVIYWGKMPNPLVWGGATLAASVIAMLGFTLFQKIRKGFADVL